MTSSQKDLINLLKKSMFGNELENSEINWKLVYNEALLQAVLAFVYDSTNDIENIPEDVYRGLKQYTISVMLKNEQVFQGQQTLVELLEKNNVDYAVLKGLTVAINYTKPELRTLGDVDFLVRKEEFQSVKKLLVENGYTLLRDEGTHFHCSLKKQDVLFEMHLEMSEFPNTPFGRDLREFLDNALDEFEEYEYQGEKFKGLSLKYQMFSLLLHMERHILKDGLGLRQLLDFGFFVDKHPEIMSDDKYVSLLKKYGLYKMATVCVDLMNKYFLDKETENPTADMLIEMSLKRGNFGVKTSHDESLSNRIIGDKSGANRITVIRWFNYFKFKSRYSWKLATKYPWISNFGFIYLPIRYFCRRVTGNKKAVDLGVVINTSKKANELFNDLELFNFDNV